MGALLVVGAAAIATYEILHACGHHALPVSAQPLGRPGPTPCLALGGLERTEDSVSEHPRMLDGAKPPKPGQVAEWIGPKASAYWAETHRVHRVSVSRRLRAYVVVRRQEWAGLYGSRSSKSFCNLIPRGSVKLWWCSGQKSVRKSTRSCRSSLLTSETTTQEPLRSMTGSGLPS